jgi:pimeloyl-ACP methyl ester carboxylesterase
VITEAGRDAAKLIYVTSVLADAGRSHADSGSSSGPAPWVQPHPDGTLELGGDRIRELFFADCDDRIYHEALTHKARQDVAALTTPVTVPAWRTVPSAYVVCTQDRAIPAEAQRAAAARAGRTVEIPTGHHPSLSRPDLFGETLAGTIRTSATLPT